MGLVEADRGTERGDRRWAEKLAAYALLTPGALAEATGYENARVLVVCPDARRRDRLAGLVAEAGGAAAGRIWLASGDALERPHLAAPLWRRPGGQRLEPLVSAHNLGGSE